MEIFGFEIRKKEDAKEEIKSFAPPVNEEGLIEYSPGGSYGTFLDLENSAKSEVELISRYRQISQHPECNSAIEDIVEEAIVQEEDDIVEINLDDLKQPKSIKNKIIDEFNNIMALMDFNNIGADLFRQWYIDGRQYWHIIINEKAPQNGILELRKIDPRKIKKIREPILDIDPRTKIKIYKGVKEYYLYYPRGMNNQSQYQTLKIAKDSVCYITSGVIDPYNKVVYSHLHKAIKPLNQLRMLEDATVIYRIARAPERRIFYIDVGNLPKPKAEQYLHGMMTKHKNRLVYDANTGEIKDDRKYMTMLEDFWLPRREGGKGTEITTLPGGQNLGEMDDVTYFKRKLFEALNVPITRLEAENQFNLGRGSEITRDELKFHKFIRKLRRRFSMLFYNLLETQLVLKGIVNKAQFKEFKESIFFKFNEDNYFTELKENEILTGRLNILNELQPFIGTFYSLEWARKNILHQSEEDIEEINKQIKKEKADPENGIHNEINPGEGQDPQNPGQPVIDPNSDDVTQPMPEPAKKSNQKK